MSENDRPIIITQSEFMRRMKEQQATGGGNMFGGMMPEMYNMVVNANHPLITELTNKDETKQKETVGQLIDLALLSQNMLKGEAMSKFIQRSVELMKS
jgi:molecular chaperone HtpG